MAMAATTQPPTRFSRSASKRAQLLEALAFLYNQRQRPISFFEIEVETGFSRAQVNDVLKGLRDSG